MENKDEKQNEINDLGVSCRRPNGHCSFLKTSTTKIRNLLNIFLGKIVFPHVFPPFSFFFAGWVSIDFSFTILITITMITANFVILLAFLFSSASADMKPKINLDKAG